MIPQHQHSPRQRAKHDRILAAALKVFAEAGYTATTMDVIALNAGVSKPTLYMYFGSKEVLFESMMLTGRDVMLESFDQPSGDMISDLLDFSWHYADTVMKPEYLSLARLIIAEAQRFPNIGRAYQKAGPDKSLKGIIAYLQLQKQRNKLAFEDGELAAQDLWALILSAPRNKALHMPDEIPKRAEIGRYLENGLRIFLKAYSTQPEIDLSSLKKTIAKRNGGKNARKTDQ